MQILPSLKLPISKILLRLFGMCIVLLPFTDLPYLAGMGGGFATKGTSFPLLLLSLLGWIQIINTKKLMVPRNVCVVMLFLFILWCVVSGLMNYGEMLDRSFMNRSGLGQYFSQVLSLFLGLNLTAFTYAVIRDYGEYNNIERFFRYSFYCVFAFSLLEIFSWVGIPSASNLLHVVSMFIHYGYYESGSVIGRLRSVSSEGSVFSGYCVFVLPVFLYGFFSGLKKGFLKNWISFCLIIFIFLSHARTAFIIFIIQCLLYGFFYIFMGRGLINKKKVFSALAAVLLIIGCYELLSSQDSSTSSRYILSSVANVDEGDNAYASSNVYRFASQVAAFNMGIDSPFFGKGLGQFGFLLGDYIPIWAMNNADFLVATGQSDKTPWMKGKVGWATVGSVYAKILSEVGFVGLLLWLSVWFFLLKNLFSIFKKSLKKYNRIDHYCVMVMAMAVASMLYGWSADSYTVYQHWIVLGMGLGYLARVQNMSLREVYEGDSV